MKPKSPLNHLDGIFGCIGGGDQCCRIGDQGSNRFAFSWDRIGIRIVDRRIHDFLDKYLRKNIHMHIYNISLAITTIL